MDRLRGEQADDKTRMDEIVKVNLRSVLFIFHNFGFYQCCGAGRSRGFLAGAGAEVFGSAAAPFLQVKNKMI